ncbi:HlyD family efflux transporter periplasmic adaptor subunit [Aquabacterium sp. A7-Y]|uniref:HlyD family efflux transporter periplasmic adaptor subunit n=1 Tax=Aquabacterium sp. A7-Y TaxID=1349605 RepID=UPI00223E7A8D|nr:HlyD family efflux transporter periplasmic adaptor subunit [Aquabacterium sp. A7-Y]MCW7541886.1 HlyD family efflux transporter periplasmic adaptor subunit [Aquabacterium sp. A7-Y]
MWFDGQAADADGGAEQARVAHLESFHARRHGPWLLGGLLALVLFVGWTAYFRVDEVTKAGGEVIASSRVQVIQAVDGGVLARLNVREGDTVQAGQPLAQLDQTRVGASVGEIEARLYALQVRAMRLRAEVTGRDVPAFPPASRAEFKEMAEVERALFLQRRIGLQEDLRTLGVAVDLSKREVQLTEQLHRDGDASKSEILRAQRALNEAESRLVGRRNKFLEDARLDLAKAEDEMAQNEQVLARKRQEQADSVFIAQTPGIVKNIRVTTVGGVLRPGEEIMQIVPAGDELVVEAKVSPASIAKVRPGLAATIRFDPYDYTLYGAVQGRVTHVSADTLKEESGRGKEIYYRVHVATGATPVTTTTGRRLEIKPGMTAQVDIRTGDRSVLDYLLKPVRRTVSESFGER